MLRGLRLLGGVNPEFVTKRYVAKYTGQPLEYLERLRLFDGVQYKVDAGGNSTYQWAELYRRIGKYKLNPVPKTHPNAKYQPDEIIADLDVNERTYRLNVNKGLLKVTKNEETGSVVILYKDYDWFRRNYHIPTLIDRMGTFTLGISEVCTLLGVKRITLTRYLRRRVVTYTKKNSHKANRRFSRDDIIGWLNGDDVTDKDKSMVVGKRRFRKNPMPESLTYTLACIYTGLKKYSVKYYVRQNVLKLDPNNKSRILTSSLDRLYMIQWNFSAYGDGRAYYTRTNIRNKFEVPDLWIDTYIRGVCDVYNCHRKRVTAAEHEKEHPKNAYGIYYLRGWAREDVDAAIARGGECPIPKLVASVNYKAKNVTDKKALAKRKAELYKQRIKVYETVPDPVELAINGVLMKKELETEARRREATEEYMKKVAYRNQVARSLDIGETKRAVITGQRLLQYSDNPENVYIVYSRSNIANLFSKTHPEPGACTLYAQDHQIETVAKNVVFTVFSGIWRASRRLTALNSKHIPAWIILTSSTSRITDMNFADKLKAVPYEVSAVGAYGYEYFLPDGTWVKCPATYGMYSVYDSELNLSGWTVGTRGFNGHHEVAMIDGPFIAIRGTFQPLLDNFYKFYKLGDGGHAYVNAAISLMMHKLGRTMWQIPVECSKCSAHDVPFDSLKWHDAEQTLITFAKNSFVDNN